MKRSYFLLPLLAFSLAAYAADEAPATETPAAPEAAAETPAAEEGAEATPAAAQDDSEKAAQATLRLRKKIEQVDKQLSALNNPSRPLQNICRSAKNRAEHDLPSIDKLAIEIADLQAKFNEAGAGDYQFEHISQDDRDKYVREGQAAHKAMLIDMKEKKSKRKIGGLDKFEIMRERYQGIPEYTQAHEWYIKTLKNLDKKWKKMADAEQAKRKNLLPAKMQAMQAADEAEFQKLSEKFSAEGEDIATVWYNPSPRNAKMLRNCINKTEDALRRNAKEPLDKNVGTVPTLLADCWSTMDNARTNMLNGHLEEAAKLLKEDASFKVILKLKTCLLPNEYREPLVAQHGDMEKEVQRRMRDYRSLKQQLERRTSTMDRSIHSVEAQLNNALSAIEKEADQDAGEQTMEIAHEDDEPKPAEATEGEEGGETADAPAEGEQPEEAAKDEEA